MSSGAWLTLLSVVSLVAGAALPARLRAPSASAFLQGLVLASVGGLVLFVVLPEAVHYGGPAALIVAFLGWALPHLVQRDEGGAAPGASGLALGAGFLGLLLHTALDGAGLATADRPLGAGPALSLAIVAHRFPVGLALWLIVTPRYGRRAGVLVLAVVSATTVLGFLLGDAWLPTGNTPGSSLFQAFVAGTLLHVLLHASDAPRAGGWRLWETLGAAAGIAGVALLPEAHAHGETGNDYAERLLSLALYSAPALLVGHALQALLAPRLAPLQRLAPTLSVDALVWSLPLLGGGLTLARAVSTGAWSLLRSSSSERPPASTDAPRTARALNAIGEVAPWVLLGLTLGAALEPGALASWRARLPPGAEVWLAAAFALPLHVSALAATPMAAGALAAGASPGAALAFMIAGPAMNLATAKRLHAELGARRALLRACLVLGYAGLLGTATNLVLEAPSSWTENSAAAGRLMGLARWPALGALGLLYLRGVLRRGPRAFLEPLAPQVQSSQTPRT